MDKIVKNKNYYDDVYEEKGNILNIKRIYRVDEYAFKDETYDELARIYRALPGYIFNPNKCCSWFGDYFNDDAEYLYVKFGKSGLILKGKLPVKDFEEWEEEFHSRIIKIPFKR